MRKKSKRILLALICSCLLLAVGIFVVYQQMQNEDPVVQEKDDFALLLDKLATETYQSIFFSMYDISTFSEEDFTTYKGVPTMKLDYRFGSGSRINEALEAVFASGNEITNVYLGVEPLELYAAEGSDIAKVRERFEAGWFSLADANPQITFEVLFPFYSMEHWLSLEESERETAFILYQQLADMLSTRSNITVFFVGGQEWLINNPGNYISPQISNDVVSQKVFLLTFCDGMLKINGSNSGEMIEKLRSQVEKYAEEPAVYPDFSDKDIVFIGDSIFGEYKGSISIPGVVNGLTGARTYNCGRGGVSASVREDQELSFPVMATGFVEETVDGQDNNFEVGVTKYLSEDPTGRELVFVVNFGLNDYFSGCPLENPEDPYDVNTYAGALRTGFATLKEKYPEATYVMMGPGQVTGFHDGTDVMGDDAGTLAEYQDLSYKLARELHIHHMDFYNEFPGEGITLDEVLADQVHYIEYGRYLAGIKIVNDLSEIFSREKIDIITEREVVDGKMQSYLTGEWKDEEVAKRRSMAVMLPNNTPALPQMGISYASIVYEAPVEGRITRLMAIIEDYDELEYVGPVRSSRDYYIYEAMSFDSIYCNWGLAVPYVADLINSDRVDNVSQAVSGIKSSASYAFKRRNRGSGYATEFTGYMTIEGYEKAVDKKGYEEEYRDTFKQAFTFADDGYTATYKDYPDATKIWPGGDETNRSGYGDAKSCFTYNEEDGLYYRSQFGKPMLDEIDDRPITVSNVVFKICEGAVRDKKDYLVFGCHGTGDAYVFTNGKVIKATWERWADSDPTIYYDEDGYEIIFNQGKTWICNIWKDYADCMKWEAQTEDLEGDSEKDSEKEVSANENL